jgi:protein-tyrosine phosphatase
MEIFENVFLGNRYDAANATLLKVLRVGCVLNVTDDLKNHFDNKPTVKQRIYKTPTIDNTSSQNSAISQLLLADECVVEGLGLGMATPGNDDAVDNNYFLFEQADTDSQMSLDETPTPTSSTPLSVDEGQIAPWDFTIGQNTDKKTVKRRKNAKKSCLTPVYEIEIVEFEKMIQYKRINIPDSMDQDLKQYFDEGVEFIHQGIQSDHTGQRFNVLVHCREARSRSVSMLLAYAMNKLGWTLADAFNHIQTKTHHHTRINDGFKRQLMEYELELMLSRQMRDGSIDLNEQSLANTLDFFPRRKRNRSYAESEFEYDSPEPYEIQPKKKRPRKTKVKPASAIAHSFPIVDSSGRKQITLLSAFKKKILQQIRENNETAMSTNIIVQEPILVEAKKQVEMEMKLITDDCIKEQMLLKQIEEQVGKLENLLKVKQANTEQKAAAPMISPKKRSITPVKKAAHPVTKKKQSSITMFLKKV